MPFFKLAFDNVTGLSFLLIVSAVNECGKKVDEMMQSEMTKLTSGLGLPPGMI